MGLKNKDFILMVLTTLFLFICCKEPSISITENEEIIPVTNFELSASSLLLGLGNVETITVIFTPENATDTSITWSSADTSVATVKDGVITGVGIGTTTITAVCGTIEKSIAVEVREGVVAVESISLSVKTLYLNKEQTATIVATVLPENATDKTVVWKSSDTSVATVSNGIVTTHEYGTATITANAGSKSASATVVVCIPVEMITLSDETVSMNVGDSKTITATVSPSNATDKNITWASSNEAVATVDNGQIKALMGGTTTITATSGGVSNSCLVTVLVPVTDIILSETTISLVEGSTYKIKSAISPSNATNKTVQWSSNNESVATVENGLITAIGIGSTTVVASADDVTKTVTVTVTANTGTIQVSNLLLSEESLSLNTGDTATVIATVNPTNADNTTVSWSSANENIATVMYGTITGIAEGTTTITATAGDISKSVSVTVKPSSIPVSNITISPNIYSLVVGNTQELAANILPSIATGRNIIWSSSDTSVATVSSAGIVTGKSAGVATITAMAVSGVTAVAEFIVSEPGFSVTIPENAVYTDDNFISLEYTKNGTVYTFKATSPFVCGYIAFYINGVQNMVSQNSNYGEYSIDISTVTTKYLSIYVFGFYDANKDNYYNDLITTKNQLSIDLTQE